MNRYVSLDEKVTAQFYDEEHEEWTMQTVTIEDVLDSVCDEFTVLQYREQNILDDGTLTITVQHGMLSKANRVIVDEVGTKFCKMMYQEEPQIIRCEDCKHYNAGFECLIEGYGIERDKNWYCADAERRTE